MSPTAKTEARREKVAEVLASPGKRTRIQIAEEVGTNLAAVKRDLAVLATRFKDSADGVFAEAKAQQLAIFELMEESLISGQAEPDVVNSWRQIRESISKLLGLDAPTKHLTARVDGTDLRFKAAIAGLSEAQMEEVYLFAQRLPRDYKPQPLDATFFPTPARKELP
jgi:hypothetical protein